MLFIYPQIAIAIQHDPHGGEAMLCFAIEHDGECRFEISAEKAAHRYIQLILVKEGWRDIPSRQIRYVGVIE